MSYVAILANRLLVTDEPHHIADSRRMPPAGQRQR